MDFSVYHTANGRRIAKNSGQLLNMLTPYGVVAIIPNGKNTDFVIDLRDLARGEHQARITWGQGRVVKAIVLSKPLTDWSTKAQMKNQA
jgi:hypothetical protein